MMTHEHRYSPLMAGMGDKQYLRCQDCPHDEEITAETWQRWWNHYQQCLADGTPYRGVFGESRRFTTGGDHAKSD